MPEYFRGRKWDLVGSRWIWFGLSFVVFVIGMYFWAARGLNLGIDFTGGGLITYKLPTPLVSASEQNEALAKIRAMVTDLGIRNDVQLTGPTFGGKDQVLVRTQAQKTGDQQQHDTIMKQSDQILTALQREFPGTQKVGTDMVGGLISRELMMRALKAVLIGTVLVMVWIMIRYDLFFGQFSPKWAVSAIAALVHDLFLLVGVFAILQREVNSPFVAVLLTVVGYSVHDTIVIFDRIRENLKLRKGATFAETTNISLLETMRRSINTGVTTILTLFALMLFGGPTLHDFALAMLIGIFLGTYSSIFNASQILVVLKGREQKGRRAPQEARQSVPRPTRLRQPEPVAVTAGNAANAEAVVPEETKTVAAKKASRSSAAKKRKRRF